jgi:hypothetical protein
MKWFVERHRSSEQGRWCHSCSLAGTMSFGPTRPSMRNQLALATCGEPRVNFMRLRSNACLPVASTSQRARTLPLWSPSKPTTWSAPPVPRSIVVTLVPSISVAPAVSSAPRRSFSRRPRSSWYERTIGSAQGPTSVRSCSGR